MLVQLDGGIVHILTMLNDVAHFTVIKREVAHCDKKVGHPGGKESIRKLSRSIICL